jgi:tRNA (cmo5U34)-methyltransferase
VSDASQFRDFDRNPPAPVAEYEQTVKRVNVGYQLVMTLTHCVLRALRQPELHVLVVGAGGGAEIEWLLPANPGWRITGVDPSREMLASAQAKAERLGLGDRVTLIRGTVEDLPAEPSYDAATCLYVLHFLPDAAKLSLLRGVAERRRNGAPLVLATGARPQFEEALREDFIGGWQQYGEFAGMPADRMANIIQDLLRQHSSATSAAEYVQLLHAAGFGHVGSLMHVLGGGLASWIAR